MVRTLILEGLGEVSVDPLHKFSPNGPSRDNLRCTVTTMTRELLESGLQETSQVSLCLTVDQAEALLDRLRVQVREMRRLLGEDSLDDHG